MTYYKEVWNTVMNLNKCEFIVFLAARKNVPHKAVFLTIQKLKETRNAKNC